MSNDVPDSTSGDHAAWLATTVEEPLDPDQVICDPHHHLWDRPDGRYLLPELLADTGAGHNVVSTIFVECMSGYREFGPEPLRPVGETTFVRTIAEQSRISPRPPDQRHNQDRDQDQDRPQAVIAGIVGYADLTLGDRVEDVLTAHLVAGGPLFKGIRHATGWDADPSVRNSHTDPPEGLLLNEAFGRGLATLGAMGLSFDAWLYHPQLGELAELADRHPEVPIVLDHLGGPLGIGPYADRQREVAEQWRAAMSRLAGYENVTVKLGGIGMPIFGRGWHHQDRAPSSQDLADSWRPAVEWCIEQFGPERCMFESNFPVDRRSCSYTVLWNAFQRIAATATPAERQLLFHDTACRVYRLAPPAVDA